MENFWGQNWREGTNHPGYQCLFYIKVFFVLVHGWSYKSLAGYLHGGFQVFAFLHDKIFVSVLWGLKSFWVMTLVRADKLVLVSFIEEFEGIGRLPRGSDGGWRRNVSQSESLKGPRRFSVDHLWETPFTHSFNRYIYSLLPSLIIRFLVHVAQRRLRWIDLNYNAICTCTASDYFFWDLVLVSNEQITKLLR